jgi:hypothetical protein
MGDTGQETEQERQRRLRLEAEKSTPVKETITTDPVTGARTVKIEGSEHNLSAANPNTPTINRPVAPDESAAETQRLQRQDQTAQGTPVAAVPMATRSIGPAVPGANYNAYIAQNESANNPTIGYHDQSRSTAYGPYGMTAAAYQDARRANPALPADITQATPEQQTAAQNAYTQQNTRYLQSYGVEPTPGNLAAAHFLGARGLSDYLKSGTISPMAAAANGGEDRVRQIVDQRLGMNNAPASGAVPATAAVAVPAKEPVSPYALTAPSGQGLQGGVAGAPAATPGGSADAISRYHATQDNPAGLMDYARDTNNPEWLRNRAQSQVMERMQQDVAQREAQQKFNQMLATGDTKGIANAVQGRGGKGEEGSWLKMIALSFISPQLAGAEAIKLGLAPSKYVQTTFMDESGKEVAAELKMGADGRLLAGTKLDGTPLTTEEMNLAGGAIGRGKVTTGAEFFQDKGGQIYQSQRDEKGRVRFVNTQNNKIYSGAEPLQRLRDVAAVDVKRQTTMIQMAKDLATMDYGAKLKALAEYRQSEINAGRPDLTPEEMTALIGRPPAPQATVGMTQDQLRQQQQQPGSGSTVAPVAPTGTTAPAPVNPAAVPVKRETVDQAKERQAKEKMEREIQEKGRGEIVKKAGDTIAGADKIVTELVNVERAATDAVTKKNNFGTIIHGTLPGEQTIGRVLKTQDHINTQNVLDVINKQAAVNAKMLGTNPTDRDLQFVTATKPDETWPADAVAEWLRKSADGTRRTLDFARKQIETGGRYVPETPQAGTAEPGTTASGNKFKRVQ